MKSPDHYRERATAARKMAAETSHPKIKADFIGIAEQYERLAKEADEIDGDSRYGALRAFLETDCSLTTCMMLPDLDGFLTGIAVGPELIQPSEWLPVIWRAKQLAFVDSREAADVIRTGTTNFKPKSRERPAYSASECGREWNGSKNRLSLGWYAGQSRCSAYFGAMI